MELLIIQASPQLRQIVWNSSCNQNLPITLSGSDSMSALACRLKIPGAVLLVITLVAYAAEYMGPAPRYYPPAENRQVTVAAPPDASDHSESPIRFTDATVQLVVEP